MLCTSAALFTRLLQSGALPWRGRQPLHRRQRNGESAAGVVRVRSSVGNGQPDGRVPRALSDLLARKRAGVAEAELRTIIAAAAEGYPFPTNLDLDQPIGSLNAQTQAELTWRALTENWELDTYLAELEAQHGRHQSG